MAHKNNKERQARLEPNRYNYAKKKLEAAGFITTPSNDEKGLSFEFRGRTVTFWPYTGWFSGKTVTDGRGIANLIGQLKTLA